MEGRFLTQWEQGPSNPPPPEVFLLPYLSRFEKGGGLANTAKFGKAHEHIEVFTYPPRWPSPFPHPMGSKDPGYVEVPMVLGIILNFERGDMS